MEKENKKDLLKRCYIFLLTMILFLGISYAIFSYLKLGKKTNKVTTGTLVITIDDSMGDAISVKNAYPVTDEVGKSSSPYRFSLTNSGTVDANYVLKLVSDTDDIKECGCDKNNTLAKSIKYEYKKKKGNTTTTSQAKFLSKSSDWDYTSLETGTIKAKETISYEIRLWIDENTTSSEANKHLHAKVQVDAVQYTEDINE